MNRSLLAVCFWAFALTASMAFAQEIIVQPTPNTFSLSSHYSVNGRYGGISSAKGFDIKGSGDPIHAESVRESGMQLARVQQIDYLTALERAHARGYSVDERLYVYPVAPYYAPMPPRCAYNCRPGYCRCGGLPGSTCRCGH